MTKTQFEAKLAGDLRYRLVGDDVFSPWRAVIFRFACAACKAKVEQSRKFLPGDEIARPSLPRGWAELPDGGFICPKHKTALLIDGEPWPSAR